MFHNIINTTKVRSGSADDDHNLMSSIANTVQKTYSV